MPNLPQNNNCCGCTACKSVCGHQAITMKPDSLGFLYPHVDLSKCVECGLCEKVCSFNDNYTTPDNFKLPIPYGVRLRDKENLMKSRSGGAFVAFSDWVLKEGGIIYGAGFDKDFKIIHKKAISAKERDELRGSKYVQSDLRDTFRSIKEELSAGNWVLFSGTGCQVAGLKSFLPDKLKNKLITVDIVCHGVPSPFIWQDFKSYIENKFHNKIIEVDFRNKQLYGWRSHKETFKLENPKNKKIKIYTGSLFTDLFYKHIMLRPSCGNCHFCNTRRPGDLTLADFWGWEKTDPSFNADDKGASLVLVNTPKGERLFNEVRDQFETIEPKLEDCLQTHLRKPTILNPLSEAFRRDYEDKGFQFVIKKYGNISINFKIKRLLQRFMHRIQRLI